MKAILGYLVPWRAAPGESIQVHVGTEGALPYTAEILRVVGGDATPGGAGMDLRPVDAATAGLHRGPHAGQPARHRTGSGVCVPGAAGVAADGFTFVLRLHPDPGATGRQTLVHWLDDNVADAAATDAGGAGGAGAGFVIDLDAAGRPGCRLGSNGRGIEARCDVPLPRCRWSRLVVRLDPAHGALTVDWCECGEADLPPGVGATRHASATLPPGGGSWRPARSALWLALPGPPDSPYNRDTGPFDGRIEWPAWWDRALPAGDVDAAWRAALPDLSMLPAPLAAWDFSIGIETDWVVDTGPHALHGRTVQLPARGVTGSAWRGQAMHWHDAPDLYAAIHFHADDLYDAGWPACHHLTVPGDWPSGLYSLRLRVDGPGGDVTDLPFVVRARRDRATAPLAVLVSTATTLAYANYRFHLRTALNEVSLARAAVLGAHDLHLQAHPELGSSTYDVHPAGGDGCRFSSALRPVLNMSPGGDLWNLNADTHLLQWLDRLGIDADLLTDEDLHDEGVALLSRYRCLVCGSHPEYWTTPAWQALARWRDDGGRLMVLGGNGFYWRTARSAWHPHAIEVRRAEGGARYWAERPGEYAMQFTGEPGGLWARSGPDTPFALTGVGTRAIGFEGAGHYRWTEAARDPRFAFALCGSSPIAPAGGAPQSPIFGESGVLGSAAGGEIDATDPSQGTPAHALVVARSEGHGRNMVRVPEDLLMPHPAPHAGVMDGVFGEVVFFETPGGGAVFSAGSTNWLAALPADGFDGTVARLTGNVLRRFLEPAPFAMPGASDAGDG